LLSIIQSAGWPIYPLLLCSIAAMAIVIERLISLRQSKVAPPSLLAEVLSVSANNAPAPEVIKQLEAHSAMGSVLAAGLRAWTQPKAKPEDVSAAIEAAGREASHNLERFLGALGTIASAAPLLGLLGTVIGMIEIFGTQGNSLGNTNPAELAHGISVALYNTAMGLVVAIPALVFWRHLRTRVEGHTLALELAGEQLSRHIKSKFKGS
jgi:biopolymer transport protein ExbB